MNWPIKDIDTQTAIIAEKMASQGIAVDAPTLQTIYMLLQQGNEGFYAGYVKGYDDGVTAEKLRPCSTPESQ